MKYLLLLICWFTTFQFFSQNNGVDRIIIASGGNGDFTIGESVLSNLPNNNSSIANYFLVGFQQPDPNSKAVILPELYNVSGEVKNQVSCIGNKDGQYRISLSNVNGSLTIVLINKQQSSTDTLVKAQNFTTTALEYPIDGLGKGEYEVLITYKSSTNNSISKTETFQILEANNLCDIKPYTGVTPNGDGKNDIWIIEGITNYENNEVELFSRWGDQVWKQKAYDNKENAFKGLDSEGRKVSSGTYFFVIKAGKGSNPIKGWLEVIAQ